MHADIEEALGRELREVADGLHVPALPPLPREPSSTGRRWLPVLVAAAVVVLVLGLVVVLASVRGGHDLEPAPPSPPPTRTGAEGPIPKTPPTVPYVLDQKLYVDGRHVAGDWWKVEFGAKGWIAIRPDYTWWRGTGPDANAIEGLDDSSPVISPNGQYVGDIGIENGAGVLSGFETREGGEGLGGVGIDVGDRQDGTAVTVRAATDDGRIIAQGSETGVLWLPLVDNSTVDLTVTAPGQVVVANTPAGLVVTDGQDGRPYLAEISDAGELSEKGPLPALDDIVVSPGGAWLAGATEGSMGGEVASLPTLAAQSVSGAQRATLTAPVGWGFRVLAWAWEDDQYLVAPVLDDRDRERMARCRVPSGRCVLIDGQ